MTITRSFSETMTIKNDSVLKRICHFGSKPTPRTFRFNAPRACLTGPTKSDNIWNRFLRAYRSLATLLVVRAEFNSSTALQMAIWSAACQLRFLVKGAMSLGFHRYTSFGPNCPKTSSRQLKLCTALSLNI